MARLMQNNFLNYTVNRSQFFYLCDLAANKDDTLLKKLVKKLFDKSDLQPDSERCKDMIIYNNVTFIQANCPELLKLSGAKTYEDLLSISKHVVLAVSYGDFYSTNDNYPYMCERGQRRRFWMHKDTGIMFRVEISKNIID